MAIPASVIPATNNYSVHFAGGLPEEPETRFDAEGFSVATAATAALLKAHQTDVRRFVAGDTPAISRLRVFLESAGAKASAFSPAPAPGVPGEGFWKTTVAVVRAEDEPSPFPEPSRPWWLTRENRKVEWDCLLIAFAGARDPGTVSAEEMRAPDLWLASRNAGSGGDDGSGADAWMERGAGAVAVFGPGRVDWVSRNAAFGKSRGSRAEKIPGFEEAAGRGPAFGYFAAGAVHGLVEELLGESLFEKTWVRVDRESLEIRPLHLAAACRTGLAAALSAQEAGVGEGRDILLRKTGELLGRVRGRVREWVPEARAWGSKGR